MKFLNIKQTEKQLAFFHCYPAISFLFDRMFIKLELKPFSFKRFAIK